MHGGGVGNAIESMLKWAGYVQELETEMLEAVENPMGRRRMESWPLPVVGGD